MRDHEAQPAVILVSGGLDSATVLAMATNAGFACRTLAFDYGQRHRVELEAAAEVSRSLGAIEHRVVTLGLQGIAASALTDSSIDVPVDRAEKEMSADIPVTYVPARNLVFLSLAAAYAETIGAFDIFLGVNAIDYSGYPDCRPEFIESFVQTAALATKAGVEGSPFRIRTPLIDLSKAEIIEKGTALGVDYSITHSCYAPTADGLACGRCDSCHLRAKGFRDAGVADPTRYAEGVSA
ncbi:MAG: 7-cyano-7-deazaguanine synthase QueC [Planctomycetota bacterium]